MACCVIRITAIKCSMTGLAITIGYNLCTVYESLKFPLQIIGYSYRDICATFKSSEEEYNLMPDICDELKEVEEDIKIEGERYRKAIADLPALGTDEIKREKKNLNKNIKNNASKLKKTAYDEKIDEAEVTKLAVDIDKDSYNLDKVMQVEEKRKKHDKIEDKLFDEKNKIRKRMRDMNVTCPTK